MVFINGTSCISPQYSFLMETFLTEVVNHSGPFLVAQEPNYKELINPALARRLSRYIKMGVTTALTSLKDAKIEMPGGIITGTGLGSTEDNEKILDAMYEHQERLINPTNFIQSTHNTISSQIAIMLKCHAYNNTYVHRDFSFESALLDAILLLEQGHSHNVLVGGVDAITEGHYRNYARINRWRSNEMGSLKMIKSPGKGVIPGEGSVHFVLDSKPGSNKYARLAGMEMIYKPSSVKDVIDSALKLLDKCQMQPMDIDLLITGRNGDEQTDHYYTDFTSSIFRDTNSAFYKHLCGKYETAGAFAMWLATMIISRQIIPAGIIDKLNPNNKLKTDRILIYTHHRGDHHSLYVLTRD